MKSAIAAVVMALALSACVAVPYEPAPAYGYYYGPGAYYYGPPAATFHFGYHHRRHYRHRH